MGFLERAERLGHDLDALKRGEKVDSTVTVQSLDHFKELFAGDLTDQHRTDFDANPPQLPESGDLGASHMHELMRYVYGSHTPSDAASAYAEKLFPIRVQAVSCSDVTVNTDEKYGPAGPPVAINAEKLTFNGGSITAITTSLTITAENLLVAKPSTKPYTVAILGNAGASGAPGTDGKPYTSPAKAGSNASAPSPGICTGASDGGNGQDGAKGNPGTPGDPGHDGQANLPATITIKAVDANNESAFVVHTQSGAGGNGGKGGDGGTGQDGGHGGNGCDSGCEGTDGGNGGQAGAGGNGGDGGNGGNGVSGVQISISFPNASRNFLQLTPSTAPYGQGGNYGSGGSPGNPGAGGSGGKHKSNGQKGGGNSAGSHGDRGKDGTATGAPGNISVNYT